MATATPNLTYLEYLFSQAHGSAISMCYVGNGGSVVTIGTRIQAGTTLTLGESASDGSMPTSSSASDTLDGASTGAEDAGCDVSDPVFTADIDQFLCDLIPDVDQNGNIELPDLPWTVDEIKYFIDTPFRLTNEIQHSIHDWLYDPYHNHVTAFPWSYSDDRSNGHFTRSTIIIPKFEIAARLGSNEADILVVAEGIGMLWGMAGNDRLSGGVKVDWLDGGGGNDLLTGADGDDNLAGAAGSDTLEGGNGFDIATYEHASSGVSASLTNPGQNTGDAEGDRYISIEGVIGSAFVDVLIGNGADNVLDGGEGDDVLDGSNGNNLLKAGAGNDRLYSGADADVLDGGSGMDTVSYSNAAAMVRVYLWDVSRNTGAAKGDSYTGIEVIDGSNFGDVFEGDDLANAFWGAAGDDRMRGWGGADTLSGGDGDDKLEGGADADHLNGGNGFDTASYSGAAFGVGVYLHNIGLNTGDAAGDTYVSIEVIDGSTHSDVLEGNSGINTFWGDAGHDVLKGLGGADVLSGGAGGDQLYGGDGADSLDGGADFDFAVYGDAASGVLVDLLNMARNTGEAAGDVYVSIEGVKGSNYADQFYGTAGWDGFYGGAGDDVLDGRGGGDQLDGGEGFDFAVYWGVASGVIASLASGAGTGGDAAGDVFVSIEGLQGSSYADRLTGNSLGNTLYGWGSNDQLYGLAGNDYIEGGDGADTISGGDGSDWLLGNAGRDVFRFDIWSGVGKIDTLADFSVSEDKIELETSVFGFAAQMDAAGNALNGVLSSAAFKLGTAATTTEQRIVYDKASGAIYFDADGLGGQAQVQFAKVAADTALSAVHFQLLTL